MRTGISKSALGFVIVCLVVLLLPLTVTAEVQTQVTETANFSPAESSNNEVANLANGTTTFNINTWNPLPAGIFVGGTVKESLISLHEIGAGASAQIMLTTKIRFDRQYIMSGVSDFWVRAPLDMTITPDCMGFAILRDFGTWTTGSTYETWISGHPYAQLKVVTSGANAKAVMLDGDGTLNHRDPVFTSTDLSQSRFINEGRLYMHYAAPLYPDIDYLLVLWARYDNCSEINSRPFQFYLSNGDLASDNITESRVAYEYLPDPATLHKQDYAVPADLGWSFVFTTGLAGGGAVVDRYFAAGDVLRWDVVVPSATGTNGSANFIWDFQSDDNAQLYYSLAGYDMVYSSGTGRQILNPAYWTSGVRGPTSGPLIASNKDNLTYGVANGYYHWRFYLTVLSPIRLKFMLADAPDTMAQVPIYAGGWVDQLIGGFHYQQLFNSVMASAKESIGNHVEIDLANNRVDKYFMTMWSSITVDHFTVNTSSIQANTHHGPSFWGGIGNWISDHWVDLTAAALIIGGAALILTGVGAGYGMYLIAAGVSMFLYEHWETFRGLVNGVVKGILDGLNWLGNWLWKIGQMILKALTWFVDQAIYYGSILIGLLIIGVAIALFVTPIYALIKIMGAFLLMAQGDYEKAAAQLSGLVSQGRNVVSKGTGGRLG